MSERGGVSQTEEAFALKMGETSVLEDDVVVDGVAVPALDTSVEGGVSIRRARVLALVARAIFPLQFARGRDWGGRDGE